MAHVCTDSKMPPFGVAEAIVPQADAFAFWLLTHRDPLGALFWQTAVLRECLPSPERDLEFHADGPLMRHTPRTALVRISLDGAST